MKNRSPLMVSIVLAIVVIVIFTLALTGCGSTMVANPNPTPTPTPTPTPGKVAIVCVDHVQIGVVSPTTYVCTASETVAWSVSNTSLAAISSTGSESAALTPNTTTTGVVTVTATATTGNDTAGSATVKVVDWILYGTSYPGIFIINPDGSGAQQVLPISSNCMDFSWSYDHLEFICANIVGTPPAVFTAYSTDGTMSGTKELYTLNLNTIGGVEGADYPSLAHDGTKIVFNGLALTNVNGTNINTEGTWTTNINGTGLTELSVEPDNINIWKPRFSPDGREILYQKGSNVWLMNADGSNQHQLVSATSWQGIFSPDMKKLYYTNGSGAFMANADGSNATLVAPAGDTVYGTSPNGTSILVWNISTGTISVANSDGSNPKEIASLAGNPTW